KIAGILPDERIVRPKGMKCCGTAVINYAIARGGEGQYQVASNEAAEGIALDDGAGAVVRRRRVGGACAGCHIGCGLATHAGHNGRRQSACDVSGEAGREITSLEIGQSAAIAGELV